MDTDCLFCKIRDGRIPADITYRDEYVLAFADIGPKAPFHDLVVPLRHIATLADASAGRRRAVRPHDGRRLPLARESGRAAGGFRVVMNAGPDAGQSVHHVHLHVLAGRPLAWPPG